MLHHPILLTKQQLLHPITIARKKLAEIGAHAPSKKEQALLREGLFVLALSTVEYMLQDVLAELLREIPAKLPEKSFQISKDQLVDSDLDILEEQIQKYILGISYKRLDEFIQVFCECLSIKLDGFQSLHGDALQELKETRNLLIHNDLRTNSLYLLKAGRAARSKRADERLNIDHAYFLSSITVLDELCKACQSQIEMKYSDFTKIKAIQLLWEYVFQTPIMQFNDYWEQDEKVDSIRLKRTDFHGGLSSSEKIFLGVWLNHYNQSGNDYIKRFSFQPLSGGSKVKMIWFLSVVSRFPLY